tara:strand:- start:527 stop:1357 length:831 start_codon:yes stop_codon:yes gene_type:complete
MTGASEAATTKMTLNSAGVLEVNTTSGTQPSYFNSFLNVQNNASTSNNASITITSGSAGFAGLHFGDSDNGRIGQVAYNNSDNTLSLTANNSTRMTVESDGDVTIEDGDLVIGTGQHGIDFASAAAGTGGTGAAETSTATVLDDYEEGTFTPESNSVTTGSGSITAVGMYVKVGNLVNISVRFTPSGASTNAHQFGMYLPFKAGTTESSGSFNTWIGGVSFSTAQGTGLHRHFRLGGDSNFGETKVQSSTGISNTTGNGETGNFSFDMSITYRTID